MKNPPPEPKISEVELMLMVHSLDTALLDLQGMRERLARILDRARTELKRVREGRQQCP